MHMKYCYILFLSLWTSIGVAQVKVPAITQQAINEIEEIHQNKKSSDKKLEDLYPILKISGKDYISTIAKVGAGFSENNLPTGFVVGSRIGDIITLKIPVDQIHQIQFVQNVEYLEMASKIQPNVTKAGVDLRADSVQQGLGVDLPFTGKDVLIGVTDWGFDYTHPMFYDTALQQTRILASWDQFKTSGPAPAGQSYGTEYVGVSELMIAESDTACTYYSYATHGNHVAGIAGGGGAGIGLKGVAYDANFLFCAIHLETGGVIDAVKWMSDFADSEGKRLVINMSWGLYHLGPMDGTSLLSQALDNYSDQGVVIVTSGGNNGDVEFHIKKDFANDSIVTGIDFYSYSAHPNMWGQSISMWGEPNKSFKAGFEVRSGSSVVMQTPIYSTATAAAYLDSMMVWGTDTVWFNLTAEAQHPQSNRSYFRLRVKNTNTILRVVLRSYADNGTVHYWNVTELDNGAGNWGMPFSNVAGGNTSGDAFYAVGEPACTKKIITVAAHGSENRLPNGVIINGSLASFSSEGPAMGDHMKPDVSAPGVSVESSISSFTDRSYTTSSSTTFNGKTYDFAKFSGTSMSSPATAGVVALMLEANPSLTPAEIKDILIRTARQDDKTGVIPTTGSTEWGHGKVTATAAIIEAYKTVGVQENSTLPVVIYPNPVQDEINVISAKAVENNSIQIYGMDGKKVMDVFGQNTVHVEHLAKGIYIVRFENNGTVCRVEICERIK